MIDWKERYMREVEGLNNEGDPIGGDPPSGLRHQIEALKAENEALRKIKEAAENLFSQKDNYHNEQKVIALTNALAKSNEGDRK